MRNDDFPMVPTREHITGLILAGGRGLRMGGADKGLMPLDGRPMVEYVIQRLRSQVEDILISANRNHEQYAEFGYRVIPDTSEGFLGPLAGVASGLHAAKTEYVLTVPCDSPLIGDDLAARLGQALMRDATELAVAHDGRQPQRSFLLLRRSLVSDLTAFLASDERKVQHWLAQNRVATADFRDCPEKFANIDDPSEYQAIEALLQEKADAMLVR